MLRRSCDMSIRCFFFVALLHVAAARSLHAKPHSDDDRLRHEKVEAIKLDIIQKLGLKHRPPHSHINVSVAEQRRMIRQYRESVGESENPVHDLFPEEDRYAKEVHLFNADTRIPSHLGSYQPTDDRVYLHFNVHLSHPNDPMNELSVYSANLKLYITDVLVADGFESAEEDGKVRIDVMLVTSQTENNAQVIRRQLVDSKLVSLEANQYVDFNVRSAMQAWIDEPGYGLELVVPGGTTINQIFKFQMPSESNTITAPRFFASDFQPRIFARTQERPVLDRTRREGDSNDCASAAGEKRCCKNPMWVSFKEIGWNDWILAPEGFEAGYCSGSCPHGFKPAHTHALIKTVMRSFNPAAAAPQPCCAAIKLKPLKLLLYNEDKGLVITEHADMIVEECACS